MEDLYDKAAGPALWIAIGGGFAVFYAIHLLRGQRRRDADAADDFDRHLEELRRDQKQD